MTCDNENTAITVVAEILSEQGFDGLASALKVLLNELMLIEREQYLGAAAYERSEGCRGLRWCLPWRWKSLKRGRPVRSI